MITSHKIESSEFWEENPFKYTLVYNRFPNPSIELTASTVRDAHYMRKSISYIISETYHLSIGDKSNKTYTFQGKNTSAIVQVAFSDYKIWITFPGNLTLEVVQKIDAHINMCLYELSEI